MRRVLRLSLVLACAACAPAAAPPSTDPLAFPLDGVPSEVTELVEAARAKVRESPGYDSNWAELGMVYLANALPEPATWAVREALSRDPDDGRSWYLLALCEQKLAGDEAAVEPARRSARHAPEESCPRAYVGGLLFQMGRLDEAGSVLREALALDERDPVAAANLGRVLLQEGELEEACALLERLSDLYPEDGHLRLLLATALRRSGRTEEARARLAPGTDGTGTRLYHRWERELAAHRADSRILLWTRAGEHRNAGRLDEAIALIEELTRRDERDPQLWNFLGRLHAEAGQVDRAQAALQRCLELEPGRREATLDLVGLLISRGRLEPARELIERALVQHAGYSRAHRYHALLLERLARPAEAADAYRLAVEADARDPELWRDYGRFLLRSQDWEGARAAFETGRERGDHGVEARLGQAEALLELGRAAEAAALLAEESGPPLPATRPVQRLRRRVERALQAAAVAAGDG